MKIEMVGPERDSPGISTKGEANQKPAGGNPREAPSRVNPRGALWGGPGCPGQPEWTSTRCAGCCAFGSGQRRGEREALWLLYGGEPRAGPASD